MTNKTHPFELSGWTVQPEMKKKNALSVLLVDDSALVRKRVRRMLAEDPGIGELLEAGDAMEGYAIFKLRRPHAVVIDLNLPDENGFALLALIKKAVPSTVSIIFTASAVHGIEEQSLGHGSDGFLNKADDFPKLARTIRQLVARKRRLVRMHTADQESIKQDACA